MKQLNLKSNLKSMKLVLIASGFVFLLGSVPHAFTFTAGEAATLVIGQSSFTTNTAASNATGLYDPFGVAFDSHGNLWVTDAFNNRVLEYTAPLSTGEAATLVIGQSSFTTNTAATTSTGLQIPYGIAFDSGNLWVADTI